MLVMKNYPVNQKVLDEQRAIVASFCHDAHVDINIGYSNTVIVAYMGTEKFVFRFSKDIINRRLLKQEQEVCRELQNKTSFAIPDIKLLEQNGHLFTMHKFIEGETLNNFNKKGMTQQQYMNFCRDCINFIQESRNIHPKDFPQDTQSGIFTQIETLLDTFHIQKNEELFALTKELENQEFHFIHGDFNANNIILKEDGHIQGIIDFNMSGFSNYHFDLSKLIGYLDDNQTTILLREFHKCTGDEVSPALLEKIRCLRMMQEKNIITGELYQQNNIQFAAGHKYEANLI